MAALSNFQKMKVTQVLPSGDFTVDCINTACRLAGFVTTSNRWSSQAIAALSRLVVEQPLKGQPIMFHISLCHMAGALWVFSCCSR